MVELLEQIKNDALKAFAFRIYNNMTSFGIVILPTIAVVLIDYINKNDIERLSQIFVWEAWDKILLIIIVQILTSISAGAFKAQREAEKDLG